MLQAGSPSCSNTSPAEAWTSLIEPAISSMTRSGRPAKIGVRVKNWRSTTEPALPMTRNATPTCDDSQTALARAQPHDAPRPHSTLAVSLGQRCPPRWQCSLGPEHARDARHAEIAGDRDVARL